MAAQVDASIELVHQLGGVLGGGKGPICIIGTPGCIHGAWYGGIDGPEGILILIGCPAKYLN